MAQGRSHMNMATDVRLLITLLIIAATPQPTTAGLLNSPSLLGYWPLNSQFWNHELLGAQADAIFGSSVTLITGPNNSTAFQTSNTSAAAVSHISFPILYDGAMEFTVAVFVLTTASGDGFMSCSNDSTSKLFMKRESPANKVQFGFVSDNQDTNCGFSGWTLVGGTIKNSQTKLTAFCGSSFAGWQTFTPNMLFSERCNLGYSRASNMQYKVGFACLSVYNAVLASSDAASLVADCAAVQQLCSTNCQPGTCEYNSNTTNFECTCKTGWDPASFCSQPLCTLPCQNGGSCAQPDICDCPSGYGGVDCSGLGCSPACVNGNCTGSNICTCDSGYTGATCDTPICSSPCLHNGTCTAPETCTCAAGWNGTTCSSPICTTSCKNGGNCTAPNTCTCVTGWIGSTCQTASCSPSCVHGNCTAPDTCTCVTGWQGADCSSAICNPACENGGTCVTPNHCNCTSTHSGSTCHWYVCNPPCQNGNCTSPDVCTCEPGWTDSECGTAICTQECTNSGNCTAPDYCTCTSDFTGNYCQLPNCFGTGCKNGGTCISPNHCLCTTEYFGQDCGLAHCAQTCLHGGNCTAPNYCTCTADMWEGNDCSIPMCVPNCNNGGTCISGGVCACPTGYTDSRCETDFCSPACVHGNCSAGSCECAFGYAGATCNIDYCQPPCQHGGTCTAGICTCSSIWTGSTCNVEVCSPACLHGGTCVNQTCVCTLAWTGPTCATTCSTTCANGGTCVAGQCQCSPGWTGSDCTSSLCQSGFCQNNGSCNGLNTCACPSRWTGDNCTTPNCIPACVSGVCVNNGSASVCTCASNWKGSYCEIPVCNPTCSNGGVCKTAGGSTCYCSGQWTGSNCNQVATTTYVGNSAFAPDGSSKWTSSRLMQSFVADTADSSTSSNTENCCPCGSLVMDGSCYFVINLDSTLYLETPTNFNSAQQSCVTAGGTLATFATGNPKAKMATFFQWLATDANIQLPQGPVDFWNAATGVCLWLGVYRDKVDLNWYWETFPPLVVDSSLWIDNQEMQYSRNNACVVPHKLNPMLRAISSSSQMAAICQIRNPCSQQCKAGSTRIFDRCYTKGSGIEADRLAAAQSCDSDGGTLASVRQAFEFSYWSNAVYAPSNSIRNLWIGYNHLKSDYFWDNANIQLQQPYDVRWDPTNSAPSDQIDNKCTITTSTGWQDFACNSTLFTPPSAAPNYACQGSLINPNLQPTTFAPATSPRIVTTTPYVVTSTRGSYCVQPECDVTPPCPTNYFYVNCYDSCYRIVNNPNTNYFNALADCINDGAHFFVPNRDDEFYDVLDFAQIATTQDYWLGLQDWARSGSQNLLGSYNADPDKVWHWMDDSPQTIGSNFTQLAKRRKRRAHRSWSSSWSTTPANLGHLWADASESYNWLPFNVNPMSNSYKYAYLTNDAWYGWVVGLETNSGTNKAYICEYSSACSVCPANWYKYLGKCFYYISNNLDYATTTSLCSNMSHSVPWTPKTEGLIVYAAVMSSNQIKNKNMWIGLDSLGGTWTWLDDGSAVVASNGLNVNNNEPQGGDNVMVTGTNPNGQWQGEVATNARAGMCQLASPAYATTTSTTTPSTTTTTSCMDGCCPCGFHFNKDTNKCYQMSLTSDTRQNAMMACAKIGSYLVAPLSQSELQSLFTDSYFVQNSYWSSLSKNAYAVWTWPDGSYPETNIIASPPLSTATNCYGAVVNRPVPQGITPVCSTGTTVNVTSPTLNMTSISYSDSKYWICEIANPCQACRIPQPEALLTPRLLESGYALPLRVSQTKCIWIFDDKSNIRANNVQACSKANLSPLSLLTRYENEVLEQYLGQSLRRVWTDLTLSKNTPYTWDGESTSYTRVLTTPDNTWQQSCANIDYGTCSINVDSCANSRYPICTVPSAASCADMCPEGYTWLAGDTTGGSCFRAVFAGGQTNSPFDARQNCYTTYGSYNLASITSDAMLSDLLNYLKQTGVPNGTRFWIGLDNSIRTSINDYVHFSGDPDSVWEWDNGLNTFPTGFWVGVPSISTTGWAYVVYDAATPSLPVSTLVAGTTTQNMYYICERPQPCLTCDSGWIFFNGNCYKNIHISAAYFNQFRGACDFYGGALVSIRTPISQQFGKSILWNTVYLPYIGLYRKRSPVFSSNTPLSYWEWDDGSDLASNNFEYWVPSEPNLGNLGLATSVEPLAIAQLYGHIPGWTDLDYYHQSTDTVCQKPAKILSYNCPITGSGPSVCGDSLVSSMYTNVTGGYSASTFIATNPPQGMATNGNPWIPQSTDTVNPWLKISFGTNPVYVRAISTLGGTTGWVQAYQVGYTTSAGAIAYESLYVHRSAAYHTKTQPITFAGNAVTSVKNTQEICPPRMAYDVKIMPKLWSNLPIMRVEMKGCSVSVSTSSYCSCWVELVPNTNQPNWWSSNMLNTFPYLLNEVSYDSLATGAQDGTPLYKESTPSQSVPYGWTPNTVDSANWWQATFAVLKVVTGLVMTGSQAPGSTARISSYYVKWSHTGYAYTFNYYMTIDGSPKLFMGPMTPTTVTQQTFCPPMKAMAIQIIPNAYVSSPSLLIDIFGCGARGRRCFDCCDEVGLCTCNCPIGWTGTTCATVVSDVNYYIDAQPPVCENDDLAPFAHNHTWGGSVTSSSEYLSGFYAFAVAANSPTNAWAPALSDLRPFVQFDFGEVRSISMIQVAGNSGGRTSEYSIWFKVENMGQTLFYPILTSQGDATSLIMRVPGARDLDPQNFVPYRLCPNIRTKVLRLQPLYYFGSYPMMRVKVFGCPAHAPCSTCCTYTSGCTCNCPIGFSTNVQSSSAVNPWNHCEQWSLQAIDCEDLALRQPGLPSGSYVIYPPGRPSMKVYCEMDLFGGGWTVFQKRVDRTQDFLLTWADYKAGFGLLDSNFWLGNDNIYQLTTSVNSYSLLIVMTTVDDVLGMAHYSDFYIENEANNYKLHLGSFTCGNAGDSLSYHNLYPFSTKDRDHSSASCCALYYGAWWYGGCHHSNLNGIYGSSTYGQGLNWYTFRNYYESVVTTKMMIRRSPLPYSLPSYVPNYLSYPTDCQDILEANPNAGNGVYRIYPALVQQTTIVNVYCDMVALGGGWTTIQRHYDYSLNFNQNFSSFQSGFGDPSGNFYLGNDLFYLMTNISLTNLPYSLAVVMEDLTGEKRTAIYDTFYVTKNDPVSYRIYVLGYQNRRTETPGDSLSDHNDYRFRTPDQPLGQTCPSLRSTGWFQFNNIDGSADKDHCLVANPNGAYGNGGFELGINWATWKGRYESLKAITLMIKRPDPKPLDCQDILFQNSLATSGAYWIYPLGMAPVTVYCDMAVDSTGKAGWTVFQRRFNNDTNFYRSWSAYKVGFSQPTPSSPPTSIKDFWLGNDNLYQITASAAYSLRVTMTLPNGTINYYALYDDFKVGSETQGYSLFVQNYVSAVSNAGDALSYHNGKNFSTYDGGSAPGCSQTFKGGWWYGACHAVNLNGIYNDSTYGVGLNWNTAAGYYTSLINVHMAIRRKVVVDVPNAQTTVICASLNIVLHQCNHPYQEKGGDKYRMPVPRLGTGVFTGSDLICGPYPTPQDCGYIQSIATDQMSKYLSQTYSGLYTSETGAFTAFCDQTTMGGGYTVIQRRVSNQQTFLQDATGYDLSFGSYVDNFWLGNSVIRSLTAMDVYELLVEMRDVNDNYAFALYNSFYTTSNVNILHISGYQSCSTAGDSLSTLNGFQYIVDTCLTGGWWRSASCTFLAGASNLNAPYQPVSCDRGIYWWTYAGAYCPSLAWTEMKIRRQGTHGRYIIATDFRCDTPIIANYTVADAQACQDQCTAYGMGCVLVVFDRASLCKLKSAVCVPHDGLGFTDSNFDSYFRIDSCTQVSPSCGPPPSMVGTNMVIVDMPANLTVNYTCRPGYTNFAWSGDMTNLTCNPTTKRWVGKWLNCKTLCGDYPIIPNANMQPDISIADGVTTLFYECAPDYEWVAGDLTRICAPPVLYWQGDYLNCSSTLCAGKPNVPHSTDNSTGLATPSNRRYTVLNYTCGLGYVFSSSLQKSAFTFCSETRDWQPISPGTCIPLSCGKSPNVTNCVISPNAAAMPQVWDYLTTVIYVCLYDRVIDPLMWDNNVTISCVGNNTWGVINYIGPNGPKPNWLPSVCKGLIASFHLGTTVTTAMVMSSSGLSTSLVSKHQDVSKLLKTINAFLRSQS